MRGFGVERNDERWVEVRRSESGMVRLVNVRALPYSRKLADPGEPLSISGAAWRAIADRLADDLSIRLAIKPKAWGKGTTAIRQDLGEDVARLFGAIAKLDEPSYAARSSGPLTEYQERIQGVFRIWIDGPPGSITASIAEPEPAEPFGRETKTVREWRKDARMSREDLAAVIRSQLGNSRGDDLVTLVITWEATGLYSASRIEPWDRPVENAPAVMGGAR